MELYDKVTQVLDDYGILYGDIVDNGDGSVNIVGIDEEEWDEVVDAIKAELGLDVIFPAYDHDELDNELIVRESLEEVKESKLDEGRYADISSKLAKAKEELKELKVKLDNAPNEEARNDLFDAINSKEIEIGDLEGELAEIRYIDNGSANDYSGYESLKEDEHPHAKSWFRLTFKDGTHEDDYIEVKVKQGMSEEDLKDYFQNYYDEEIVEIKQVGWTPESLKESEAEEEPKLETFEDKMDFLAKDEQEAIDGYNEKLGKTNTIEEDLDTSKLDVDSVIGWISEHDELYNDFKEYFSYEYDESSGEEKNKPSLNKIIDWLFEHNQAFEDFKSYFKLEEENYYLCSIYGGYNCQELLADNIEVYAKNEEKAKKEAIKIYKQEYDYSRHENPFGLEVEINSSDEEDDEDDDELIVRESLKESEAEEEPKLETFEDKMDFLAKDEQEAIDGYDKVIAMLDKEADAFVIEQLTKIKVEEEAHKKYLEDVKSNKELEYTEPLEQEDKESAEIQPISKKFLDSIDDKKDESLNETEAPKYADDLEIEIANKLEKAFPQSKGVHDNSTDIVMDIVDYYQTYYDEGKTQDEIRAKLIAKLPDYGVTHMGMAGRIIDLVIKEFGIDKWDWSEGHPTESLKEDRKNLTQNEVSERISKIKTYQELKDFLKEHPELSLDSNGAGELSVWTTLDDGEMLGDIVGIVDQFYDDWYKEHHCDKSFEEDLLEGLSANDFYNQLIDVIEEYIENLENEDGDTFAGTEDSYANEMLSQHVWELVDQLDTTNEKKETIFSKIINNAVKDPTGFSGYLTIRFGSKKESCVKEGKELKEYNLPKDAKPYKTCGDKEYYIATFDDVDRSMMNNKATHTIVTKKVGGDFDLGSASGLDFNSEEEAKKWIDDACSLKEVFKYCIVDNETHEVVKDEQGDMCFDTEDEAKKFVGTGQSIKRRRFSNEGKEIKEDLDPSISDKLYDLYNEGDVYFDIAKDKDGDDFLIIDSWEDVRKIQKALKPDFEPKDEYDTSVLDELFDNGYQWGFRDEYSKCDNCGNVIRTEADSYSWVPDFFVDEENGEILCGDCVRENPKAYLETLYNNPEKANTILSAQDLIDNGFEKIDGDYEDGWYDRHDSPEEILNKALEAHPNGVFIFHISGQGQFATQFELWGADLDLDESKKKDIKEEKEEHKVEIHHENGDVETKTFNTHEEACKAYDEASIGGDIVKVCRYSNDECEEVKELEESLKESYKDNDLIEFEDDAPMTFGEIVDMMYDEIKDGALDDEAYTCKLSDEELEDLAIQYAHEYINDKKGHKAKKEAKR